MNLTKDKVQLMMDMQDRLNQKLNPDWKVQGWNWGLAIIDECMELHGHLGWKWWKDSSQYKVGVNDQNRRQIQLEVVDVWHFIMSRAMAQGWTAKEVMNRLQDPHDTSNIYSSVDNLLEAAASGFVPVEEFTDLMNHAKMAGEDLFNIYVGKFALNQFRWDHGYGEGKYLKQWLIPEVSAMYREDNWYLELILKDLCDHQIEVTVDKVRCGLVSYYKRVTGGK